jgi:hypothetical protein
MRPINYRLEVVCSTLPSNKYSRDLPVEITPTSTPALARPATSSPIMPAQAPTRGQPRRVAAPARGRTRRATRDASPEGEDFDWSPVQAAMEEEDTDADVDSNAPSGMATRFSTPSVQVQPVTNKTSKKKQAHDILRFFKPEEIVEGGKTVKKKVCQLCRYAFALPMILVTHIPHHL